MFADYRQNNGLAIAACFRMSEDLMLEQEVSG